jgi:8-oxo-dGTP diphosphatase
MKAPGKNNKVQKNNFSGPAVAVDILIFSIINKNLKVLLLRITQGHYKDQWALPGGLVGISETLDGAAERVLQEKAGIKGLYLEQLYTFGGLKRDVRGRSVSVAYFALVDSDKFIPKTTEYYSDICWQEALKLPVMAFDHKEIVRCGVERLRSKIGYSNIAYGLLPKEFTLSELQGVYEIILGEKLDKRNFRKKLKMLDIVDATKRLRLGRKNRPAELYRFKKRGLVFTK